MEEIKKAKEEKEEPQQKQVEKNQVSLMSRVEKMLAMETQQQDKELNVKKKKKILVNTSKARGELKLLKFLVQMNNWKEVFNMEGDVLWAGLPLASDELGICLEILTNRIPGVKELSHKKEMGYYLNKFREYYPGLFDFYPLTFLYPEQKDEFTNYTKNHQGLYIAKPTGGSQGDGIKIIKNSKELGISEYTPSQNELIIQEYIYKPMLIDGKKFDFRLYVLISSIDPFICYLDNEGLVRFCAEKYEIPNNQNIKNSFMHLTNYHLNKDHPDFKLPKEDDDILGINSANKRTYTSVLKQIKQMGYDVDKIKSDIDDLIIKFMTSMYPFIIYNCKTAFEGKQGKCFHALGFDILLDEKGKPWLLEINANPSFSIDHEVYYSNGKTETEPSPLDKYIKAKVVGDSIRIVLKKPQKQLQIGKFNCYRSFKQIVCDDLKEQEMEVLTNMLTVYGKLSGFKFRGSITSSRFAKLASYQGMTNQSVTKTDYDIIFKKILFQNSNTQLMSFYDFINAMEYLASKLIATYNPKDKLPAITELLNNIIHQFE